MKKLLAALLICSMFFPIFNSMAETNETKTFDHTVFKKYSDNYYYDKFDKEWLYGDVYTKTFKEITVEIALTIVGIDSVQLAGDGTEYKIPPVSVLSITVTSKEGEPIYEVEKFSIFVDEKLYSYSNKETEKKSILKRLEDSDDFVAPVKEKNTTNFLIPLGSVGHQMIRDIAQAKEISMKLNFIIYKYDFLKYVSSSEISTIIEPTLKQFSKIITVCKNLKKYGALDDVYYSGFKNEDGIDYMDFIDSEIEATVQ